jgi:hypothetical protein
MKNAEIRSWYLARVAEIAKLNQQWIARGMSLEERARQAGQIRHDARLRARSMMESSAEIKDLEERDRRLYGSPDGPSFDQLVREGRERGLPADEAYERIIKGARSTNPEVNKRLELKEPPP